MVFKKQLFVKIFTIFFITIFLINNSLLNIYGNNQYFCEVYGEVVRVIDGDTLDLRVLEIYSSKYSYLDNRVIRIRFADINTPELNTSKGVEARNIVVNQLDQHGWISCLDIDDYDEPTDHYGRYIAIIYIRYNSTHWLNLNKWLLDSNYADIMDFRDNEFDPLNWELYVVLVYSTPINSNSERSIGINWFKNLVPNSLFILIILLIVLITIIIMKYMFTSK